MCVLNIGLQLIGGSGRGGGGGGGEEHVYDVSSIRLYVFSSGWCPLPRSKVMIVTFIYCFACQCNCYVGKRTF